METPLEIHWLAENAPETPLIGPGAVLAAMEVLRRAGYLVRVARPLPLPEPVMVLLPYTEAETLRAIRERPGITTLDVATKLGRTRQTIAAAVRMLGAGGHARRGEYEEAEKIYPLGDKPIARARPRERARINRKRRGQDGQPND